MYSLDVFTQPFKPAPPDHPGIPLSKLARQDEPILFFDEVTLFEDELHDNGVANLTIRIVSCLVLLSDSTDC